MASRYPEPSRPRVTAQFLRGVAYAIPFGLACWLLLALLVYGVTVFAHWNGAR